MRILLSILLAASALLSSEELATVSPPKVEDLGDGKYRLGLLSFDENTRRISFPGEVNLDDGLLEFAIVNEKGKIHESLLITQASPINLNIVLKLLRYQTSPELFKILNEDYELTDKYPEVSAEQKNAARLEILVSWEADGEKHEAPINELIYHTTTEKEMESSPWVYHGSYLHEGTFEAESTGDIAAIFISRGSLLNFSGADNHTDEPWITHTKKTPPVGTPVTITLSPLLQKPKQ